MSVAKPMSSPGPPSAPTPKSPLKIAVLISGGGTTLRNFIEKMRSGVLDVHIKQVVSSRRSAGGLQFSAEAAIPSIVVERCKFDTPEALGEAIFEPCRAAAVDLVVMGGFLHLVFVPPDFENRVMNIHPALIPAFCGKGYYGLHVHRAVLEYGAKITGCTVHFVDNQYDHGPIILQRSVPVQDDDTPETLAARVFQAECDAYPEAIRRFAAGKLRVDGRKVVVG